MNEQINDELNILEPQNVSNENKMILKLQVQPIKKVKKEKNKSQRKNQKNNAQTLTEEERAVNKLMAVSSRQDNSLSRQLIEDITVDNYQNTQIDLNHLSFKDSNTSCGWDDGFHVNYHLCDLKHFCSQMQSLDDLDKASTRNENQKDSTSQKENGKQNKCDVFMNKIRCGPDFQFSKQEIARQERCRTIHEKHCQQMRQNNQICQCKDIQQEQKLNQNGLIEQQISSVKSIYFSKSNIIQFSSNKKFMKMLRKQSQNINYQIYQQQKQDNSKLNTGTINAGEAEEANKGVFQIQDIYKFTNRSIHSFDGQQKQFDEDENLQQQQQNKSSEKQSLRSQYKAILEYYNIPSPKLSQIECNPNQQKTGHLNATQSQRINIAGRQTSQKIRVNHHIEAVGNKLSMTANIFSTQNFQDLKATLSKNPFRTIQSISPSNQKNFKNENQQIQRIVPLDNTGEERKLLLNQQNNNINQKLYKTSPLSKNSSSPFDRQDQQQHHPQVYQIKKSFQNIKKIFFKSPDSAISHGSESTLEQSRQQEAIKQENSVNLSSLETNLPKLNQNYSVLQKNKNDAKFKNKASQQNLNQRMNKYKLEYEKLKITTSDVSDTSQERPLDCLEQDQNFSVEAKYFQKNFLNEHNNKANQTNNQGKCKDICQINYIKGNKAKAFVENKQDNVSNRENTQNKINEYNQNGKNQWQLLQILQPKEQLLQQHTHKIDKNLEINKQQIEQIKHFDQRNYHKQKLDEETQIKNNNNKNQSINSRHQNQINQKNIQFNNNFQSGEEEQQSTRDTIQANQKIIYTVHDFSNQNNPSSPIQLQYTAFNANMKKRDQNYTMVSNKQEPFDKTQIRLNCLQECNCDELNQKLKAVEIQSCKAQIDQHKLKPLPKEVMHNKKPLNKIEIQNEDHNDNEKEKDEQIKKYQAIESKSKLQELQQEKYQKISQEKNFSDLNIQNQKNDITNITLQETLNKDIKLPSLAISNNQLYSMSKEQYQMCKNAKKQSPQRNYQVNYTQS